MSHLIAKVDMISVLSHDTWFYKKDSKTGAEYIRMGKNIIRHTKKMSDRINVDLDYKGNVVGVEII